MELRFVAPDLKNLDELDSEVLACAIWSDVRPSHGVAGLVDWRLAGRISALQRRGLVTGVEDEVVMIPGKPRLTFDKLVLFGAKADIAKPDAVFQTTSTLRFSGAERVAVLAYGKTTHLAAQGDWRDPGFGGGILPTSRTIYNNGYSADWTVPFIARGVRAEGPADSFAGLNTTALGVSFIEVADPYQSVSRSLKYVLLFLGLVFLTYFIFEATTGKRVHPAQYILVGIAQIIFYLLLLSF